MNNFQIWSDDNPMPQPLVKSMTWIGNRIEFIAAQCNSSKFYISCADDEPEILKVRLA